VSRVRVLLTVASAVLLCACTGASVTAPPPGSPVAVPSVQAQGAATAEEAIRELCVAPDLPEPEPVVTGDLPPQIVDLIAQVETARGLSFQHPPAVEAISDTEMDRKLEVSFDIYYPADLYDRRTVAWRTIGVIDQDADLLEAYRAYLTGQVIGFYDPQTGELVYLGEGEKLGLAERLVLAHELTHALDDQHFHLKRLDRLVARCADEAFAASLGLVEGSAQHFSSAAVLTDPNLDLDEFAQMLADAGRAQAALEEVPPFVQALQSWPYVAGQSFVAALAARGGTETVDAAMEHPPVSTEQVIHPELFPSDVPQPVDVADLTGALGPAWGDLDAMQVGEEWLSAMLALRGMPLTSARAAAGWDGGVYRAFTDGTDVVVVLQTAWDSEADAQEFVISMDDWNEATPGASNVDVKFAGGGVRVVFSTGPDELETALNALNA